MTVHKAVDITSFFCLSFVKPMKIGNVPNGFITENKAAKLSKNRFIFSFFIFISTKEEFTYYSLIKLLLSIC